MIDRSIWKTALTERTKTTVWPCPNCATGRLQMKEGALQFSRDAATLMVIDEEWWEPEMETGRFAALLHCNNTSCVEPVAVFGQTRLIEFHDGQFNDRQYERRYYMRGMEPPPQLFAFPEGTSASVQEALTSAFRVVWLDPSAAANRVRTAIEELLSDLGISKRQRNATRLRRRTLHERIESLPARHGAVKDQLLAIKLLGNAGSHDIVSTDDVLDALDIVAFVLDRLYVNREKKVSDLVKRITRKKRSTRR
jgi:hypothetical protein